MMDFLNRNAPSWYISAHYKTDLYAHRDQISHPLLDVLMDLHNTSK